MEVTGESAGVGGCGHRRGMDRQLEHRTSTSRYAVAGRCFITSRANQDQEVSVRGRSRRERATSEGGDEGGAPGFGQRERLSREGRPALVVASEVISVKPVLEALGVDGLDAAFTVATLEGLAQRVVDDLASPPSESPGPGRDAAARRVAGGWPPRGPNR